VSAAYERLGLGVLIEYDVVHLRTFLINYLLLSLYLSVKTMHHIRREGLEILTLIQKREEYTPLDFMKIWRSKLIKKYINSELK
jgi:hypothetical protein